MNQEGQPAESPPSVSRIRSILLNPKDLRFWALTLIILYTLVGFFLAPYLVKKALVDFLQGDLGRKTEIEQVEFNPYVLSLRITGLSIDDTDAVKMAGFSDFFVNFQLSSLFYRAWTFDEIRLDGLYFFFQRFDTESSRVSRLLDDIAELQKEKESPAPEPAKETEGGMPRLLINNLTLNGGVVDIEDDSPDTPVTLQISPIDIAISELNTLPDKAGHQEVTIKLPEGLVLHWAGSLDLAPFESEGKLNLENAQLARTIPYLKATLPLDAIQATLSSSFDYRIRVADDATKVQIDNLDLNVDSLSLTGLNPSTDFLTFEALNLKGGVFRYPEQSLQFEHLHIEGPQIAAWLKPDGVINFADLTPSTGSEDSKGRKEADDRQSDVAEEKNSEAEQATPPWVIGIEQISLANGGVNFSDHSIKPPAQLGIAGLNVELKEFSTEDGAQMPLSVSGDLQGGGQFNVDGTLNIAPATNHTLKVEATNIPLTIAQPYIQQHLRVYIDNGLLSSNLDISLPVDQSPKVTGSLQIATLDIRDSSQKNSLLTWQSLALNRLELDIDANTLDISALEFQQPYARFAIHEDLTTNVSDLLIRNEEGSEDSNDGEPGESTTSSAADTPKHDSGPMHVAIGGIRFDDAALDFSDMSLPLPFAAHVHSLNGTISTIAPTSSEASKIKLEGQVNEFGLARIEGDINLLDPLQRTDVALQFRNLDMPRMSPYSGQFAGRKISEGKLTLDLNYLINKGALKADNNIVLSDLLLGDKVDSPKATHLPLDLAIALLKDPDGVIDAKIPITGDVNDPQFALGGVIWDAIVGLITDVATAPFRFLGNMLGIDADDLGQIQFLAGRSDLTPPELEKISQLEIALGQRPELSIKISGTYDPDTDTPALQFNRLRETIIEKLGANLSMDNKETMLVDEIRSTLEKLFKEQFPDIPLKTLKAAHKVPPPDDPEGKSQLDQLAYVADLRDRLLAAQPIGETELRQLAADRAEVIKTTFLSKGNIDEARFVLAESKKVVSKDNEWVTLELKVAP